MNSYETPSANGPETPREPSPAPRPEPIPLTEPLESSIPASNPPGHAITAAPAADSESQRSQPRTGTVVWGLVVLALAALIIISKLGIVALNGSYVLIGLMIGAGAALVIGGLLSVRSRKSRDGASVGGSPDGASGLK